VLNNDVGGRRAGLFVQPEANTHCKLQGHLHVFVYLSRTWRSMAEGFYTVRLQGFTIHTSSTTL